MEPANQNLTNNGQDDDKTIIYSSTDNSSVKKESTEKTTINNDSEKTQFQDSSIPKPNVGRVPSNNDMEKTQIHNSQTTNLGGSTEKKEAQSTASETSNPVPNKLDELKSKKSDNKVSTGLFAAGVAGAAIGGVALGANFSDEIKEVFAVDSFDAPDSPESEAQEVIPEQETQVNEQAMGIGSDPIQTAFHGGVGLENPEASLGQEQASSFEISSTDESGNIYNVSFVDLDGDGKIDSQSGSIQLVDGTSVSFTETGENLSSLFNAKPEIASLQDYQGQPEFINLFSPANTLDTGSATHVYEIQAGDTLSEIAEANHTSIEHLMELNPDITDADEIFAGDDLVIPNNDNISNPYEVSADLADMNQNSESNTPVVSESSLAGAEVNNDEYAQVDWASFSDDAPNNGNDAYGEELAQTDFDSFETPDSYTDFDSSDYGSTDVSADFM
jgi:LysM repeat protein